MIPHQQQFQSSLKQIKIKIILEISTEFILEQLGLNFSGGLSQG